jgi:putative endopeptidase
MISKSKSLGALTLLALMAMAFGCGTEVAEVSTTNIHGIDVNNFDTTVEPCVDFYQYANGTWLANNPVPSEYGSWGTGHEVFERNNLDLKAILDEVSSGSHEPGSIAQKIGDFVASGMDLEAINETGVEPLQADFDRIEAIASVEEMCRVMSEFHAEGINMIFDVQAFEDLMNSSMVNLYVTQGGLGLPEKGYYTREDEESATLRTQYVEHIGNMFMLLGDDSTDARRHADGVMALETVLANASWTDVEMRNYPAWYRVKSVEEMAAMTPNFPWVEHLEILGVPHAERISTGPEQFFEGLNTALVELPLEDWKQYMRWRLIAANAFYVGESFDAENYRFFGTVLGGSQERPERWKRVLAQVNAFMGEALGQLYVERNFPPESKALAVEMVNNLKTAVGERLANLEWMTEETKAKALAKLGTFKHKIGYPDKWRDYSDLEIGEVPFVVNVRAGRRFAKEFELSKVGKAPDPDKWEMNPQTLNAYYTPLKNEIVFPAGILQPPYFDGEIDNAVNYGAMGAIIGHEMLHGFDDGGSRFDKDGNMVNWWTDEDRQSFEERTARLVEQFSNYTVADSLPVNGELTLGENIGDLGGLRMAYRALQIANEGKEDPMIDGFTQEQRFFLSFAQVWRQNTTDEAVKLQVQSDPHSPNRLRAIGPLSNMDEFQEAFGCSDDDPVMRPREDRIRIW